MKTTSTKAELVAELKRMKAKTELQKDTVEALMDIIHASCSDHCPHRAAEEACRNCSIKQLLNEAVGKLQRFTE